MSALFFLDLGSATVSVAAVGVSPTSSFRPFMPQQTSNAKTERPAEHAEHAEKDVSEIISPLLCLFMFHFPRIQRVLRAKIWISASFNEQLRMAQM